MASSSLLAVLGLVLVPFGSVQERLTASDPWRSFYYDDGPLLELVRGESLKVGVPCSEWVKALSALPYGVELAHTPIRDRFGDVLKTWEPWTKDEEDWLSDCDDLSCKFKLNQAEVDSMKAVKPEKRREKFISMIESRLLLYRDVNSRLGCEFPGTPLDPWGLFDKFGFRTALLQPDKPVFYFRKLDLDRSQMKPLRQMLDKRQAVASVNGHTEGVVWLRDVYTTHYFDSWGEWIGLSCDDRSHEGAVLMGMLLELDLLKKNDLLSRISRGRLKSAVQVQGAKYLDELFEHLRKAANVRKSN